ncbi:sensor histidine kinase [Paracoccus aestuariivivens]|uniref:histidine kinase n=1 Tax=Paracoccus aestuariivivens TaxID=1820333 RepID=A0A6L6J4L3_9RHOB|nr:HAMP domain-containing sensor histidine kinase [Paracoccus aestuariivivens]MTH77042.1 sensor histidine kinase [Paracoccus aestuariivivens]
MMFRPGSLIARLSWRLILLQFLTLTLMVIFASTPEPEQRGLIELDEDVPHEIARHLVLEGDRLTIRNREELIARVADFPDFWVLVTDQAGRRLEYGPVPDDVRAMFTGLQRLVEAKIYWDNSSAHRAVIAQRLTSPAGTVTVATGGGPTLPFVISRLQEINPFFLALLAALTTVSALIIPYLVRRDLSGVARVVDEAARIDIDKPGTRLTEANVPPELQAMVGAINAALTRLDEGLEKRQRFLATAAHELRTPIAILTMRIETLPPGPERAKILMDVARLASLSEQLLDLQRLEENSARFRKLELNRLAAEAVADLAPLALGVGATLAFDASAEPVEISGDAQSIQSVVTNLVQNAISHGGQGVEISIEVRSPAQLRVSDNGPGIPPADRQRIFDPFFRRSGVAGSGLGLHLVQQIVALHGGEIVATDAQGGGAEFTVSFPPARPA